MASSMKDSNPNAGATAGGGKKNDDGREMGSAYNNESEAASMDAKLTYAPNEGAPTLDGGRPGAEN